jgi:hypothetical protein
MCYATLSLLRVPYANCVRPLLRSLHLLPPICKSLIPMRQTYTQPLSSHWAPFSPSAGVAVVAATAECILQRHTGVHPASSRIRQQDAQVEWFKWLTMSCRLAHDV